MAKIKDLAVVDFSRGVRNDLSDFRKRNGETERVINFNLNNQGMATKRLGSHQFGDTDTGNIENSFYWERQTAGGSPTTFQIVNNTASTASINNIVGTRLNGAVTAGDGTITVISASAFDASGDIEIDGDVIAYTGKTATTFTGCTGVTSDHADATAVHQLDALSGTSVDGRMGVYYATLNNLLFINGRVGSSTFNGTTMTAVSDGDEPNGIFATNYRQRIYLADSGAAGGSPTRIYFSDPGDSTSWTATSFFDVEDDRGEVPTGLIVTLADEMLIWKMNSFFAYDETSLKQRSRVVGAYNHKVVRDIDGLIYTFCPSGIYVTNGRETTRISDPVQDYIKDFRPQLDTTGRRVVTNTFAANFDKFYILYVGDIKNVEETNDVVLVYDTITKGWTVWQGLTDFQHLAGLKAFNYSGVAQKYEGLFGGDASGKYYRFFSKSYIDNQSPGVSRFIKGGEIYEDLISDTGTPVRAELQTKLFDQGTTDLKQFKYVRVLSDGGAFNISYRLETRSGLTDWRSLGDVTKPSHRLAFPHDAKGYRIAFNVTHADSNEAPSLYGIVLEETNTAEDRR